MERIDVGVAAITAVDSLPDFNECRFIFSDVVSKMDGAAVSISILLFSSELELRCGELIGRRYSYFIPEFSSCVSIYWIEMSTNKVIIVNENPLYT